MAAIQRAWGQIESNSSYTDYLDVLLIWIIVVVFVVAVVVVVIDNLAVPKTVYVRPSGWNFSPASGTDQPVRQEQVTELDTPGGGTSHDLTPGNAML